MLWVLDASPFLSYPCLSARMNKNHAVGVACTSRPLLGLLLSAEGSTRCTRRKWPSVRTLCARWEEGRNLRRYCRFEVSPSNHPDMQRDDTTCRPLRCSCPEMSYGPLITGMDRKVLKQNVTNWKQIQKEQLEKEKNKQRWRISRRGRDCGCIPMRRWWERLCRLCMRRSSWLRISARDTTQARIRSGRCAS